MACIFNNELCLCGKCEHLKEGICQHGEHMRDNKCARCEERGGVKNEVGYCTGFSPLPGVTVRRCGECGVAIAGGASTDFVRCPFRMRQGVTGGFMPPDWVCDREVVRAGESRREEVET